MVIDLSNADIIQEPKPVISACTDDKVAMYNTPTFCSARRVIQHGGEFAPSSSLISIAASDMEVGNNV